MKGLKAEKRKQTRKKAKLVLQAVVVLLVFALTSVATFAWLTQGDRKVASYAPISSPQAFYIGGGHIEFEGNTYYGTEATVNQFEDVRYLYLQGIDVTNESVDHYDYVFCVYGKAIISFNLQLGYTTNNQFTYEIFNATESNVSGAIAYTTHGDNPGTYYYTPTGTALSGTFLNDKTAGGLTLGENATDEAGYPADEKYHKRTYDTYTNVDKFAEPLYWQTTTPITTSMDANYNFVNYFILRVNVNGKQENDRETDVICIAAKSGT